MFKVLDKKIFIILRLIILFIKTCVKRMEFSISGVQESFFQEELTRIYFCSLKRKSPIVAHILKNSMALGHVLELTWYFIKVCFVYRPPMQQEQPVELFRTTSLTTVNKRPLISCC